MNRLTNADAYIQTLDGSGNPTTAVASTVRYNGHEGYTYDRIGNIMTLSRDTIGAIGDWVMAYNYVAGTNKLASVSRPTATSTFGYDLAGNMVNDQYQDINTIQYGRANLPFQLLIGINATDKYDYNADDQRVYKQSIDYSLTDPDGELHFSYYLNDVGIMHVDSSWTMYVNGRNRLMEFNYTPVRAFSTGQDFVPVDVAADTVVPFFYRLYDSLNWVQQFEEFYVYDHLGNTRVLYHPGLNITGGITSIIDTLHNVVDYFPYGKILREYKYANEERYLMTYQERDSETGYDNKGARWYNSEVPHFMSLDPKATTYLSWSPYNYVMGNPVKFVDPDGKGPGDPNVTITPEVAAEAEGALKPTPGTVEPAAGETGGSAEKGAAGSLTKTYQAGGYEVFERANGDGTSTTVEAYDGQRTNNPSDRYTTIIAHGERTTVNYEVDADGNIIQKADNTVAHGNSASSTKAQTNYDITNTETGTVDKTGLSGGKTDANGTPYRANSQVNKWNKEAGYEKYKANVVNKESAGTGARQKGLDFEKTHAAELKKSGNLNNPKRHQRP